MAQRSRDASASVREIGPLPPVKNKARRARGKGSLLEFCRAYFPGRFKLAFSAGHLTAIERLQTITDSGGLFALAMPRGSGKTTLAEVAVLRAVLYGLRRFVVLVCATAPLARRRLKAIMRELEANEKLLADFPEACFPIKALGRIHNRASGQTLDGAPTRMELTAESVVLPTVPKAASSGAVLQVCGMEGAIRGLNVAGPTGEMLRPDMVLIDDAQTRESARSLSQTMERESIVSSDILGLAGPDTTIAAAMLCTVIYPGDLSDRFLDHELHPEWQGVRTRMLDAMPSNMDLWDRYAEVLRESLRSGDQGKRANQFYVENREALEAGAVVTWPQRKKPNEVSGLQSAMNEYIRDRRGFLAEYQNSPERDSGPAGCKELVPAQVIDRVNGVPRFEPPPEASTLTAFFDCGGELHWYAVCAWSAGFGGAVIDYGSYPRQTRRVFHSAEPRPGLSDLFPGMSESERVFAGLNALASEVLSREYVRAANGQRMRVERCLVDAGYQSQAVYQWCRATSFAGIVMPSKGIGRSATSRGVSEWKPRPGERTGHHWRLTMSESGRGQMAQFDPDAWKTFLFERLTQPLGGSGALTFYGRDKYEHELLAEHLSAEQSEPITLRGATFDKWSQRPHRPDNHLLDCVVGCAVAASVQGLTFDSGAASGAPLAQVQPRKRISLGEIQRRKMAERMGAV